MDRDQDISFAEEKSFDGLYNSKGLFRGLKPCGCAKAQSVVFWQSLWREHYWLPDAGVEFHPSYHVYRDLQYAWGAPRAFAALVCRECGGIYGLAHTDRKVLNQKPHMLCWIHPPEFWGIITKAMLSQSAERLLRGVLCCRQAADSLGDDPRIARLVEGHLKTMLLHLAEAGHIDHPRGRPSRPVASVRQAGLRSIEVRFQQNGEEMELEITW